jgi:1-acyl-sn-glycerol-3-phosphate acyltransferase
MPAPPKPVSEVYRPELVRLPRLTFWRRAFRRLMKGISWLLSKLLLRLTLTGLENFPGAGPALIVANHLGAADVVVGLAFTPAAPDALGKVELYDLPVVGRLMDWYGVIWVHRGRPDRRAMRAALQGLAENRMVGIAPEGRQSVSGGLEEGMGGAAYLALKADVPVIPITFTGTEDDHIFGNLKKFRRPRVSMTVGAPFHLHQTGDRRADIQSGTEQIMRTLAKMLPPEYRGVYRGETETSNDRNESDEKRL